MTKKTFQLHILWKWNWAEIPSTHFHTRSFCQPGFNDTGLQMWARILWTNENRCTRIQHKRAEQLPLKHTAVCSYGRWRSSDEVIFQSGTHLQTLHTNNPGKATGSAHKHIVMISKVIMMICSEANHFFCFFFLTQICSHLLLPKSSMRYLANVDGTEWSEYYRFLFSIEHNIVIHRHTNVSTHCSL